MQDERAQLEDRGTRIWGCSACATPTDRRNARIANLWGLFWLPVFFLSVWVLKHYGEHSLVVCLGALLVGGLGMVPFVRAQLRFLREADELTRAIQLQAMGVAFGVGILAAVFERFLAKALELLGGSAAAVREFHALNPLLAMVVAFVVAMVVLMRRYSR
jgi:hypothetical protein